jgi:hypothetical protein
MWKENGGAIPLFLSLGKADGQSIANRIIDTGKLVSGILLSNPSSCRTGHCLVNPGCRIMMPMEQVRAEDRMQMRADCM